MTTNPPDESSLLARVQTLEQRLFGPELDGDDPMRIKSEKYSWLYRPSHHVKTGLVTEEDVALLSQPGKRILSVGAHPAYLERVLVELGIPADHILVADKLADITSASDIPSQPFDMLEEWPDIGLFDLIVFPESICIAMTDKIKEMGASGQEQSLRDTLEAQLLATILSEALLHLQPGGEIRANGPQSHPNVINKTRKNLREEKVMHELDYERYFLKVRHAVS